VLGPVENQQYWEYSKDIHDSGKRLLKIINEILDVSRIEVGDRQLNEGNVSMSNVIEMCLGFIRGRNNKQQLTITNLSGEAIPNVIGEELAIKQILVNLLTNAVKFTPDGGRVPGKKGNKTPLE
jgi:two-component system cell cycle sensor histidine kinase PleC